MLGDTKGVVHVFSTKMESSTASTESALPRGAIATAHDPSPLFSPVTDLATLYVDQQEGDIKVLGIVSGHHDGHVSYSTVAPDSSSLSHDAMAHSQILHSHNEEESHGPIISLKVSSVVKRRGKLVAVVAALHQGGQLRTGMLRLLPRPELRWITPAGSSIRTQRIMSVEVRPTNVFLFHEDGSVGRIAVKAGGERHVHLPVHFCRGWQFESAISAVHESQVDGDKTPAAFSITSDGAFVVVRSGSGPGCSLLGSAHHFISQGGTIQGQPFLSLGQSVRMAALPGYVFMTTMNNHLILANVTGPPRNRVPVLVLATSIPGLAESIPGLEGALPGDGLFNILWRRSTSAFEKSRDESLVMPAAPLIATTTSGCDPVAPNSNGRVLLQVKPRVAALYATSLPHDSVYRRRSGTGKATFSWLQALHPILLLGTIGFAVYRTKMGRHQSALSRSFSNKNATRDVGHHRLELERRIYGGAGGGAGDRYATARRRLATRDFDDDDTCDGETSNFSSSHQANIDYAPWPHECGQLSDERRQHNSIPLEGRADSRSEPDVWD